MITININNDKDVTINLDSALKRTESIVSGENSLNDKSIEKDKESFTEALKYADGVMKKLANFYYENSNETVIETFNYPTVLQVIMRYDIEQIDNAITEYETKKCKALVKNLGSENKWRE